MYDIEMIRIKLNKYRRIIGATHVIVEYDNNFVDQAYTPCDDLRDVKLRWFTLHSI